MVAAGVSAGEKLGLETGSVTWGVGKEPSTPGLGCGADISGNLVEVSSNVSTAPSPYSFLVVLDNEERAHLTPV